MGEGCQLMNFRCNLFLHARVMRNYNLTLFNALTKFFALNTFFSASGVTIQPTSATDRWELVFEIAGQDTWPPLASCITAGLVSALYVAVTLASL